MIVAGLMSGTSLDGIDVAFVEFRRRRFELKAFKTFPYPAQLRTSLLQLGTIADLARMDFLLGELYANAVLRLSRRTGIKPDLIACHGQTVFHQGQPQPFLDRLIACTLQIGNPAVIAERTGTPVVSNFRSRDIAAGGQGAPLVPFVDYFLFRHPTRCRVALNIGGIANVTIIPAGANPDQVIAFDTGPGNMVIDALVEHFTRGRQKFDRNGRIAARGRVNTALLDELLADPYYEAPPPKSTGREKFGSAFVTRLLAVRDSMPNLIATATCLTAATVALGIRRFSPAVPSELIVSGGGAHNSRLLDFLSAFLPGTAVLSSSAFGIDPDAKEALAFAILGYRTWRRLPSNLPSATGARHPVILGHLTP